MVVPSDSTSSPAAPGLPGQTIRVLIVCGHEPELDPRIDWSARWAPDEVVRVVLGFHDPRRPRPDEEVVDSLYRIVRLHRDELGVLRGAAVLATAFFRFAPRGLSWLTALLVAVAGPPSLLAFEIGNLLFNAATVPVRLVSHLTRRSLIARVVRAMLRRVAVTPTPKWCRRVSSFRWMLRHFARVNAGLLRAGLSLKPCDVVHANDLETLPAAVLLKWAMGCRVIYDSHEYWPYSDVEASRAEQVLWSRVERLLLRHVDVAITVSGPLAEVLSAETGREFLEVPNCEPRSLAYDGIVARPASRDLVRFLFLGAFAPERGIEELIRAWARVADPRAQLVLQGPDNAFKQQCVALVGQLGLVGRTVHFAEPVLERDLVRAASDFDVGIIPYKPRSLAYRFCCPNKLSQYMQAGLAVLTNDLVYIKALVDRYEFGMAYDSDRPETLVDAVRRLVDGGETLDRFKRNAKAAARTQFNWQERSKPLYAAYRGLVCQQRG